MKRFGGRKKNPWLLGVVINGAARILRNRYKGSRPGNYNHRPYVFSSSDHGTHDDVLPPSMQEQIATGTNRSKALWWSQAQTSSRTSERQARALAANERRLKFEHTEQGTPWQRVIILKVHQRYPTQAKACFRLSTESSLSDGFEREMKVKKYPTWHVFGHTQVSKELSSTTHCPVEVRFPFRAPPLPAAS